MSKLHIKKGDNVYVLSGDDKGKTGRVLAVQRDKNRFLGERVNIFGKGTKPSAEHREGGRVKKEAPINISNVNLVDPKTGKPTRIAIKRVDGKAVRISKKSNQEIK